MHLKKCFTCVNSQRTRWLDSITHSMDMKSEQALRIVDAQGSLVCYSPWGGKEPDMTERLNWTELYEYYYYFFFMFVLCWQKFHTQVSTYDFRSYLHVLFKVIGYSQIKIS